MRSVLLLNQESGSLKRDATLEDRTIAAAQAEDPHVAIVHCAPDELGAAARAAATPDTLVLASGGDGTVGTIAGALTGTEATLGVVPTGTWNNFARDLGVFPGSIEEAMAVAYRGRTAVVDLARAGDRIFINNCSIGVYPHFVEERQRLQPDAGRLFAWTAALSMAWERFPVEHVRLSVDGGPAVELETPLLFVGNNAYTVQAPGAGRRARLDAGVLWVCVARAGTQLQLLEQTITSWVLGMDHAEGIEAFTCRTLDVAAVGPALTLAADGERFDAPSPVRICTLPGAVRVRVSSAAP